MPIYEYDCEDCRRRVSLLVLKPSAAEPPRCPRCGGSALTRLMSRFATIKSEQLPCEESPMTHPKAPPYELPVAIS